MNNAQRFRSIYRFEKPDRLPRREFSIWEQTKDRWRTEGWNGDMSVFKFDSDTGFVQSPIDLGWTNAPINPPFQEEILKEQDNTEYVRTSTGEIRQYPKGKRHGVMPTFVKAPVNSRSEWEDIIKPRLDPDQPGRWENYQERIMSAKHLVQNGEALFDARIIGGYMYVRSLLGPEKVLYCFYDDPDLIHDMMRTWLHLQCTCLSRIQDEVSFFRLFMAEDIAYKNSPLISPFMLEAFFMPYYRELIGHLKCRQKTFMHVEVDTDGNPAQVLPVYIRNGFDAWSPCEVAAGCDPVEFGKKFPGIVIRGGIDKRILAEGKEAIRRELDRIIPCMMDRGGFIPNCDHGVPDDVSFENYMFYRETITSMDFYK